MISLFFAAFQIFIGLSFAQTLSDGTPVANTLLSSYPSCLASQSGCCSTDGGCSLTFRYRVAAQGASASKEFKNIYIGDTLCRAATGTTSSTACDSQSCPYTCSVPSGAGGEVKIAVEFSQNPGQLYTQSITFRYFTPAISQLTPSLVPSSGSSSRDITIGGSNFGIASSGTSTIKIAFAASSGQTSSCGSIQHVSSSQLKCKLADNLPVGSGSITVEVGGSVSQPATLTVTSGSSSSTSSSSATATPQSSSGNTAPSKAPTPPPVATTIPFPVSSTTPSTKPVAVGPVIETTAFVTFATGKTLAEFSPLYSTVQSTIIAAVRETYDLSSTDPDLDGFWQFYSPTEDSTGAVTFILSITHRTRARRMAGLLLTPQSAIDLATYVASTPVVSKVEAVAGRVAATVSLAATPTSTVDSTTLVGSSSSLSSSKSSSSSCSVACIAGITLSGGILGIISLVFTLTDIGKRVFTGCHSLAKRNSESSSSERDSQVAQESSAASSRGRNVSPQDSFASNASYSALSDAEYY